MEQPIYDFLLVMVTKLEATAGKPPREIWMNAKDLDRLKEERKIPISLGADPNSVFTIPIKVVIDMPEGGVVIK